MNRMYVFILIIFGIQGSRANAAEPFYFSLTSDVTEAYDAILHYDLARADSLMQAEDPDNLLTTYLQDYIDVLPVILNEDARAYEHGLDELEKRQERFQDADKAEPWRLYCLGEMHLRWAIADYKMGHEWRAAMRLIKANRYLQRGYSDFPEFPLYKKPIGLINALMGAMPIPSYLKWIAGRMTGINPSVELGYEQILSLKNLDAPEIFFKQVEIQVMLAYINLHMLNRPELSWYAVQQLDIKPESSMLAAFVQANVAMRTGRNDNVIQVLESQPARVFDNFPYLHYMMGKAKLRRLDIDADRSFLAFLEKYRGTSFVKSAYERLYWHDLVNEHPNPERYILKAHASGASITDTDRQADFDLDRDGHPNINLLKARLLFDGGYFDEAAVVLKTIQSDSLSAADYLEMVYRSARIDHKRDNLENAIGLYQHVIDLGRDRPEYYACNAALQMGLIYEAQDRWHLAKAKYDTCLDIRPAGYIRSLHMQARAGISRVKSQFERN